MKIYYDNNNELSEEARKLIDFDADSIRRVVAAERGEEPDVWLAATDGYQASGHLLRDSESIRLIAYSKNAVSFTGPMDATPAVTSWMRRSKRTRTKSWRHCPGSHNYRNPCSSAWPGSSRASKQCRSNPATSSWIDPTIFSTLTPLLGTSGSDSLQRDRNSFEQGRLNSVG